MPEFTEVDAIIPAGSGIMTVTRDTVAEDIAGASWVREWFFPSVGKRRGTGLGMMYRCQARGLIAHSFTNPPAKQDWIDAAHLYPAAGFGVSPDTGLGQTSNGGLVFQRDPAGNPRAPDTSCPLIGPRSFAIIGAFKILPAGGGNIVAGATLTNIPSISVDSSGRIVCSRNIAGTPTFDVRAGDYRNRSGWYMYDWNYEAAQAVLYVSGAVVSGPTNGLAQFDIVATQVRMGGSGIDGTGNSGVATGIFAGEHIFVEGSALLPERSQWLAKVQARFNACYPLTALS
jgi:hypothetical protein